MSIPYVADSPDHSLLKFQDQNHNHATNSDRKDWFLGNMFHTYLSYPVFG